MAFLEIENLSKTFVRSTAGQLVPLSTVATVTRAAGPLTVNHQGQLPAVTISTHVRSGSGIWLSEVVASFGLLLVILGVVISYLATLKLSALQAAKSSSAPAPSGPEPGPTPAATTQPA